MRRLWNDRTFCRCWAHQPTQSTVRHVVQQTRGNREKVLLGNTSLWGFPVFAVQHGGQCFGSADGLNTYNKYGPSTTCASDGEGGPWGNEVYRITGQTLVNGVRVYGMICDIAEDRSTLSPLPTDTIWLRPCRNIVQIPLPKTLFWHGNCEAV